jgi:hypothetical protein
LLKTKKSFENEIQIKNENLKINDKIKFYSEKNKEIDYGKIEKIIINKDEYNIQIIIKKYKKKIK